ncbi:hypothetical protein Pyn_20913 [Prunus yedoensis var. nudiflora]|uniref:Uncharacterized protein n=1 Tax=Prunus yedoensis var. nudiflora TaxID=2094558 RepID=A0A314Y938_PRUYE|nr:hypothetical protein Pyn_20913 [Prunus yedoensis var. nudiflora]
MTNLITANVAKLAIIRKHVANQQVNSLQVPKWSLNLDKGNQNLRWQEEGGKYSNQGQTLMLQREQVFHNLL